MVKDYVPKILRQIFNFSRQNSKLFKLIWQNILFFQNEVNFTILNRFFFKFTIFKNIDFLKMFYFNFKRVYQLLLDCFQS